jgi:ribosomal-protein-alanine N-acetyltransferase
VCSPYLTNSAARPHQRGRGTGRDLLGTVLEMYRQQGFTRAALEVRPSNHRARRLYEAFGFQQVGLRKGYYFDTGEDALLMEARLDSPVRLEAGQAAAPNPSGRAPGRGGNSSPG